MTKFEQVGINFLYDCKGKEDLNRTFNYSCKCCCSKGMRINCERCAISYNYSMLIAITDDKEKEN